MYTDTKICIKVSKARFKIVIMNTSANKSEPPEPKNEFELEFELKASMRKCLDAKSVHTILNAMIEALLLENPTDAVFFIPSQGADAISSI